jgi:hypothetical protein
MKKDRPRSKEPKRVRSFNLSDSCIDKLEHLSHITKTHNKSAIVQRLIEHEYIMTMAKREKAQGKILDYIEPHLLEYAARSAFAESNNLIEPRCNPGAAEGRCAVCDDADHTQGRRLEFDTRLRKFVYVNLEKTYLRGVE